MEACYIMRGDSIDYVPTEQVKAGDIVVLCHDSPCNGYFVGVSKMDIAPGEEGQISLNGVYEIQVKSPLSPSEFHQGDIVFWNPVEHRVSKSAIESNVILGKCAWANPDSAKTIYVLLTNQCRT